MFISEHYMQYMQNTCYLLHILKHYNILLCLTTLRTHITSHTLLYYILKNMYMN